MKARSSAIQVSTESRIPSGRLRALLPFGIFLASRQRVCYNAPRKAKRKYFLIGILVAVPLTCSILLTFSAPPAFPQTLVTFDDLSGGGNIPNGYQGLSWSNFYVVNAILVAGNLGTDGYYYGMVSPSNVAFNAGGNPAEIDSATNFDFFSAYLTGAWNSNLNIEVEGFNGAQEIYDTIVVASATNATLFTFDYFNIDRLLFTSSGGESAGFTDGEGNIFVMDNFLFEFIPEPSTLLLALLGTVPLCAFFRRERT